MKQTKFILLTVVVALILMGAGYAAWTQAFMIDGTISTGELFVQVKNTQNTYEVLDAEGNVVSQGELDTDNNYLNLTVTSETQDEGTEKETLTEITFNLSNIYPGTRQISEITFENLGTLKTITTIDNASIVPAQGNALWEDVVIQVNGVQIDNGNDAQQKLENLAQAIKNAVGDLEPDELKSVTIVQELPSSSANDTQDLSLTWTVPLIFEQYNM